MSKTLSAAVGTVLALSLAACGGGSGGGTSAADQARASRSVSDIVMRKDGNGPAQFVSLRRKDADCIGKGLVDKIGTKQLKKYGLLRNDLKPSRKTLTTVAMSPADAKDATDVVFGCTDVPARAKAAIGKSGMVPKRMGACVDRTLTERSLRTVFTRLFEGRQQEATKTLTAPLTRCALGKAS
jgi:hypothetical protein